MDASGETNYTIPPPPPPEQKLEDLPTEKKPTSPTRTPTVSFPSHKKAPDIAPFERRNWLIHQFYVKKDFEKCKAVIKARLEESSGLCEYALYVQGLISRVEGKIQESLEMFQTCCFLSPNNVGNLKQVARSLFLLGRHKAAIDIYMEAAKLSVEPDWAIYHNQGICHIYLASQGHREQYELAKECLKQAISCSKHHFTFVMLAKVYLMEGSFELAIETYKRAIEYFPDNPDLLTTLGLLYLQTGDFQKAFENLGSALSFDPVHSKAILAAGSIIQTHGDFEVALTKYRISALKSKESAPLWNNIGMCFFGKRKYVAAISCLKRANYLAPFDWKVLYNLGLIHLTTGQHASAFNYLSASVSISGGLSATSSSANSASTSSLSGATSTKCGMALMLLGIALANLEDKSNAEKCYVSAMGLNEEEPLIPLNYSAFAYQNGDMSKAHEMFQQFQRRLSKKQSAATGSGTPYEMTPEMDALVKKLEPALHLGEAAVINQNSSKRSADGSNRKSNRRTAQELAS